MAYSLDVLLSQFGISPLFDVSFNLHNREAGKVVWYSHLFKNFPQRVAEVFLEEVAISPTIEPLSGRPQTGEHLYQRSSCTVAKVLGPTIDFPTWRSGKEIENLQRIWHSHRIWQKLVRTKMAEDLTSSRPWASLYAHYNALAYSKWHIHQHHDGSETNYEKPKVGGGLILQLSTLSLK